MLVVVAGLPGSGKSYFASRLASRMGACYFNSDGIRKSSGALGKYAFEDKLLVYREMAKRAEKVLRGNMPVVVDATFYHKDMRKLFIDLASATATPIYFILVHATEDLIRERLRMPRPDSEADFSVYTGIRDIFEEFDLPHLSLLSTNDNLASMLAEAEAYIPQPHGSA